VKRIFLPTAIIISLTMFSTYGQTQNPQPSNSACSLTVSRSPAIRGVKLGMKIEDVLAMFPGSAEDERIKSSIEKVDGFPNFGIGEIYITPAVYSTRDRYREILSYRLVALDGRIVMYNVEYSSPPDGPTWHRVDDFIARMAEAFDLPPAKDWIVDQNLRDRKTLKCDGFQLEASNSNYRGSLTVSTIDHPYKTKQLRREAFEEKIRREFKP
jgi:hypothetical protein